MRTAHHHISSTVKLPFRYAVGATASRFFKALRDEKRIYGTRCERCQKVWVPARSFCSACRIKIDKWIPLPSTGTLAGWTGDNENDAELLALIELEGADSLFVHCLGEYTQEHLKEGQPVVAVWQEQRNGSILDIAYFKPK